MTTEVLFTHTQKNFSTDSKKFTGKEGGGCRFCKSPNTSFKNTSHAIPEFMGNKSVFCLDECDQCNSYFSEKESELKKFLPPSWFTQILGKSNRYDTSYLTSPKNTTVTFEDDFEGKFIDITCNTQGDYKNLFLKGRNFSNVSVYKALLKILISLIPSNYLNNFNDAIAWLMDEKSNFSKLKNKPLIITGIQQPDFRLPKIMEIALTRQTFNKSVVYYLKGRFNNFYLQVPFVTEGKVQNERVKVTPARTKIEEILFQKIDLSDYVSKHNYKFNLRLPDSYYNK